MAVSGFRKGGGAQPQTILTTTNHGPPSRGPGDNVPGGGFGGQSPPREKILKIRASEVTGKLVLAEINKNIYATK